MTASQKEWEAIRAFLKNTSPAALGDVFAEYVNESLHGSWDGFTHRDVTGIRRMLTDLIIYHDNRI